MLSEIGASRNGKKNKSPKKAKYLTDLRASGVYLD